MKWIAPLAALSMLVLVPVASAHGALEINELETYAISDFEGQEDSFPWEGWDIWDVYVGDGYSMAHGAHGAYFKVNLAGSGETRPTGSAEWSVTFDYRIGSEEFHRTITHDGTDVTTDFEELEWQIADGNVFQVRAWAPVANWTDQAVSDLVVRAYVDDSLRDAAPGGIYDPVTGTEIPIAAPPTPVFPALGEGRIVDSVPLTGAAKFLNITTQNLGDGAFSLTITNPLAVQGQHVLFQTPTNSSWALTGDLAAFSLDGDATQTVGIGLSPNLAGTVVEPVRFDIVTDVGGQQAFYAYLHGEEVHLTDDVTQAHTTTLSEPTQEASGLPLMGVIAAVAVALARRVGN